MLPETGHADRLDLLTAVRRRLGAAQLLAAGSVGILIGAVVAGFARASGWSRLSASLATLGVACIVTLLWWLRTRSGRTNMAAAGRIERTRPEFQNVVFTAAELAEHPGRARPWIRQRVMADANRLLQGLSPRAVVPLRRLVVVCAVAVAAAIGVIFNVHERAAEVIVATIQRAADGGSAESQPRIVITLQPPAHTKLPTVRLVQPDRLNAVEGTDVRLVIEGGQPRRVRFGTRTLALRQEQGATVAEHTLRESGYLAIEGDGGPRLIPVAVTPDRAPVIKVEKPGRDLLVPDASPAVAVETRATDDFGLTELALRYTKVSGTGEQFEFVEGELPLSIARQDPKAWEGRASVALSRLGLEPGDSLVYRVVARDARPGDAGLASSDTFFIEVAGPGQVALEGFEMPPDRERHALSQQMIVLKIQRLRAREQGLQRDALQEQAAAIAAEQRAVRANFVFLMGGHVEDEEEEAEQSHEIQEGRLENTARREIFTAISHMARAEQGLVAVDTASALAQAKLAVDALQRAFGRNRYILRTLPVRSRVDPSRRLTGKLDDARNWTRKVPAPAGDARAKAIRELLETAISVGERLTGRGLGLRRGSQCADGGGHRDRSCGQPMAGGVETSRPVAGSARSPPATNGDRPPVRRRAGAARGRSPARGSAAGHGSRRQWHAQRRMGRGVARPSGIRQERSMRIATIFRTIAILVAAAAVVDPAISARRSQPVGVEIVVGPGTQAGLVRDRLLDQLGDAISLARPGEGDAVVLIDARTDLGSMREKVTVSAVVPDRATPNLRLVSARAPFLLLPDESAAIEVEADVSGLTGRTSIVAVTRNGIELGRTEHTWSAEPRQRLTVSIVPTGVGASVVSISAQPFPDETQQDDNTVDARIATVDRPLRVAFVEPRPSWTAGFIRRVLEADPAFEVTSVVRPSRGIDVRTGDAAEGLGILRATAARTLHRFDVVLIGAPEELHAADLESLRTFMTDRGGTVVFLPDRRPTGPYAAFVSPSGFDEVLLDAPVSLESSGAARPPRVERACRSARCLAGTPGDGYASRRSAGRCVVARR